MKYTIKPVLVDRENSSGLRMVKIKVSIKGKRTFISTGIKVKETDWEVDHVISSHKMAVSYNSVIRKKFVETETKITDALKEGDISIDLFKKQELQYVVAEYYESYIERKLSTYKPATVRRYKVSLKKLQDFDSAVTFNQVNSDWLWRFETKLRETLSNNSVHGIFKELRRVFNQAITDKVTSNYPFRGHDNVKYNKTTPVFLTDKELEAFEKALNKPMGESLFIAGKYFLLGCYSGLRISDLKRFNKEFIQGSRLILRASKNGELVSFKMHKKLRALTKELLNLPPPVSEQKMNQHIKTIAKHAKIKKSIHLHSARHTFAVKCATLGISKETTAEYLGITPNICAVYYRITGNKLDREIEKWDKQPFTRSRSKNNIIHFA